MRYLFEMFNSIFRIVQLFIYLGLTGIMVQLFFNPYMLDVSKDDGESLSSSIKTQEENTVIVDYKSEFESTRDAMYDALRLWRIRFPRIALAQSVLETGYFESSIFRGNNNAFGIKRNAHGFSQDLPECTDRVHACYSRISDSILDYLIWQRRRLEAYERKHGPVKTEEEYLHFLDNLVIGKGTYRYAEDPNYTKKLRNLLRNQTVIPEKPFQD